MDALQSFYDRFVTVTGVGRLLDTLAWAGTIGHSRITATGYAGTSDRAGYRRP